MFRMGSAPCSGASVQVGKYSCCERFCPNLNTFLAYLNLHTCLPYPFVLVRLVDSFMEQIANGTWAQSGKIHF